MNAIATYARNVEVEGMHALDVHAFAQLVERNVVTGLTVFYRNGNSALYKKVFFKNVVVNVPEERINDTNYVLFRALIKALWIARPKPNTERESAGKENAGKPSTPRMNANRGRDRYQGQSQGQPQTQ